jgi:colicin import membrane protein
VVLPPDISGNPEAVYQVTLLPGGDVLDARLTKSSGVPAYDAAVRKAIMAAQPLPVPHEPALFQQYYRRITLKFRPRE